MWNQPDAHDAAFLDAFDLEDASLVVHFVAELQNASGAVHQEPGNRWVKESVGSPGTELEFAL